MSNKRRVYYLSDSTVNSILFCMSMYLEEDDIDLERRFGPARDTLKRQQEGLTYNQKISAVEKLLANLKRSEKDS